MKDEVQPTPLASLPADDDLSRRQWLLRLGEMVVLAGVSGLVPESASALLRVAQDIAPAAPSAGTLRSFTGTFGPRAQ